MKKFASYYKYKTGNPDCEDVVKRCSSRIEPSRTTGTAVLYWNLRRMHKLVTIYQEIQNSMGYFLKVVRLGKKEG